MAPQRQPAALQPPTPHIIAGDGRDPTKPRLSFAHGGGADFRGANGTVYNVLSAPRLSLGLRTGDVDVILPGFTPLVVHGSYFTAAYWHVRSRTGRELRVEADAASNGFRVSSSSPGGSVAPFRAYALWQTHSEDDVRVVSQGANSVLLRAAGWETLLTRTAIRNALPSTRLSWRVDARVRPLDGSTHTKRHGSSNMARVAPHGLLGQSFGDAVAVFGARDDYRRRRFEMTTAAAGEDAIEGVASDYALPSADPFATAFGFSRFDATSAAPRDVSRLSGRKAQPAVATAAAVAPLDDWPGPVAATGERVQQPPECERYDGEARDVDEAALERACAGVASRDDAARERASDERRTAEQSRRKATVATQQATRPAVVAGQAAAAGAPAAAPSEVAQKKQRPRQERTDEMVEVATALRATVAQQRSALDDMQAQLWLCIEMCVGLTLALACALALLMALAVGSNALGLCGGKGRRREKELREEAGRGRTFRE